MPGYANANALYAAVAARTLKNLGVRAVVISPGSRSTPLTHAFVAEPGLDCDPVLDERTAGFFALGRAKASGVPAVLLCTSGTAAANYLPAVVESRLSGTPLIVLTADRPHEVRDCASGQTIDQVKLYGAYPVRTAELATPDSSASTLAHWRQSFVRAVEDSRGMRGPVHLNLPFRDPLAPDEAQPGFVVPEGFDLDEFCAWKRPVPVLAGDGTIADINLWTKMNVPRETHGRGLIVVGATGLHDAAKPRAFARGVLALSKHLGWPVLADSLGALRGDAASGAQVISGYDIILRDEVTAASLLPSAVIRIGQPPTSKTLRSRLAGWDVPTLAISPTGENVDPTHARTSTLRSSPELWMAEEVAARDYSDYAERWADLDATLALDLESALDEETSLREPHATRAIADHVPAGTALFVANSMPVRDTETFLPRGANAHPVFHNRGANGIDGTLGTALGVARERGRAVLLTGDLSLLHDTNALLLASRLRASLTVVLVNNAGGGIFNHLAVSRNAAFEEYWATPQSVDFAKLASAYAGVSHTVVPDRAALARALEASPENAGVRILEIRTDRAGDAAWRKALFARLGGR